MGFLKSMGFLKGKVDFSVNLDIKCKQCGTGGATQNGYCMGCIAKMVKEGKFDHLLKKDKR